MRDTDCWQRTQPVRGNWTRCATALQLAVAMAVSEPRGIEAAGSGHDGTEVDVEVVRYFGGAAFR